MWNKIIFETIFEIISVFHFTCNHVWNWKKIISAAKRSLWNYFEIISATLNVSENIHELLQQAPRNNFETISGKFLYALK